MQTLASYVAGRWQKGGGKPTELVNPSTGAVIGAGSNSPRRTIGQMVTNMAWRSAESSRAVVRRD